MGAFICPLMVDTKMGKRGYAAAYYTSEVLERPSSHLLTETLVGRVLLDEV